MASGAVKPSTATCAPPCNVSDRRRSVPGSTSGVSAKSTMTSPLCRSMRGGGGEHGVRGAGLRRLLEDFDARGNLGRFGAYGLHARRHHEGELACAGGLGGGEHVTEHRAAGDGMQHLGQARAHAHALAGSEDDDQQGMLGHCGSDGVAAGSMSLGASALEVATQPLRRYAGQNVRPAPACSPQRFTTPESKARGLRPIRNNEWQFEHMSTARAVLDRRRVDPPPCSLTRFYTIRTALQSSVRASLFSS